MSSILSLSVKETGSNCGPQLRPKLYMHSKLAHNPHLCLSKTKMALPGIERRRDGGVEETMWAREKGTHICITLDLYKFQQNDYAFHSRL